VKSRPLMLSGWMITLIRVLPFFLVGTFAAGSEDKPLQPGQTFRDCSDCPEMVVIPAGHFLMGSSDADIRRDVAAAVPFNEAEAARMYYMVFERPQHPVDIPRSFAIGRYLVTQQEFSAFVDETGYSVESGCTLWVNHKYPVDPEATWKRPGFRQTNRDPAVCVSWRDAKAYINWLNSKSHGETNASDSGPYHLPTEAEWEYAGRAGTQTARWWGDSIGSSNANCDGCGSRWDRKQTSPVGSFGINPFGLADVLGNAWEWTEDCWNESYADAPPDGSARISGTCDLRVMRGGSWNSHPWVLRSADRGRIDASERANDIGFRVARTIP
jgi:formylglycine-generating enzyme required for sulfatase activity